MTPHVWLEIGDLVEWRPYGPYTQGPRSSPWNCGPPGQVIGRVVSLDPLLVKTLGGSTYDPSWTPRWLRRLREPGAGAVVAIEEAR